MRFSVLSSGSKANSTYIESGSTRILIDCGLSARETERRLACLGVDPTKINAIFVTHEHSDHIRGIPVFSKKYRVPVYANTRTAECLKLVYGIEVFEPGQAIDIGDISMRAFRIVHDAVDPVGYVARAEGLKFGQATDLGRVTPLVRDALSHCHSILLESNHDPEMLRECEYPWVLKQRISSAHGHLSNNVAAEFLTEIIHSELQRVILGHLSENSNTQTLALKASEDAVAINRRVNGKERWSPEILCGNIHHSTPLFAVDEQVYFDAELQTSMA